MDKIEKRKEGTVLKPVIKQIDELNKLANQLNTTPTRIKNYCVKKFIEACNQYIPEMENDIKKRYIDDILK